ncbi:MAG: carboxypeptidase-like regulatory domain-containing protein, partial [Ginsengibacter sp.]
MNQFNLHVAKILLFAIPILFLSTFIYAQTNKVQGKIIDAVTKASLAGVSVTVKNSDIGTSTDVDGNFTLEVPKNSKILATFVGYHETEMNASQKDLTIQLTPSSQQLNEVVVTATGIKKEAKRLGYAIQTIDASTLTKAREAN